MTPDSAPAQEAVAEVEEAMGLALAWCRAWISGDTEEGEAADHEARTALYDYLSRCITPPAQEAAVTQQPVAYLHSITHPDWLEVCDRDAEGAFAVWAQQPACKQGDKLCPCQDGDACHYEGKDAFPATPQPTGDSQ